MNAQIRELAEQAGWDMGDEVCGFNTRLEKFAELIVRECMDIISPYGLRMENFDGGHPITDLKKHFGVE